MRVFSILVCLFVSLASLFGKPIPVPRDLRVGENRQAPIGYHDPSPAFSWKLPALAGVHSQSAYRLVVASDPAKLPEAADLWDSGKVTSDRSNWIPYAGRPIDSRQKVYWQVRFWDQKDRPSSWSDAAHFEMGLLDNSDWQAKWIRLNHSQEAKRANSGPEIVIEKAHYGVPGAPDHLVDVTAELRARFALGKRIIPASNELVAQDPAWDQPKSLRIVYRQDGQRKELILQEGEIYDFDQDKKIKRWHVPKFIPQQLRREFEIDQPIQRARLYVTARGLYQVHLNGEKVGEDYMAPGFTPYRKKIETRTYDVTDHLQPGDNAIGALLGEGWYAGTLLFQGRLGGRYPELLLQLEVTHEDGTVKRILSDESWKATNDGPIRYSSIYRGEIYDARMETTGWTLPGYDDSAWQPVHAGLVQPRDPLTPKPFRPVRITQKLSTVEVTEPEPGTFVFDLGQNMVGWPVLRIPVQKDETVTFRVAEMLNPDGTMYTRNYRGAQSKSHYTAAEDGTVTWHPEFTFYGFRYVELSGLPEGVAPSEDWVTGAVLHTDFPIHGSFTSSHPLLNQLQHNIVWGLRGNFLDIPTDCPQRDERLGWTGDAQVFAPAAFFNADVHAFFAAWLDSMRLEQAPDGAIPAIVPDTWQGKVGGPGWSDAATIIPWEAYVRTGDPGFLRENFEMMRQWVGYYQSHAEGYIPEVRAFGDWLQPYPQSGQNEGDTPTDFLCTAYFAHSAHLTAKAARILGKPREAEYYASLYENVSRALTQKFFDSEGRLTTPIETQTAYLVALDFNLLPEAMRPKAFDHLVRLVHEADNHLRTGFLGTPLLAPVLDRFGRTDLALTVLFQETYPSWFYSIHQGATTMWERWNSYSHEDGFGNDKMNSFNHYAYGAIGQWIYERIAGLAPDPEQPGYKHIFIQPAPGVPLEQAAAELETPYGLARSAWHLDGNALVLEATIPPNSRGTLRLPVDRELEVRINERRVSLEPDGPFLTAPLGPGTHSIRVEGWR
ncbi:alfa-L-rhamnosidase [Coraliomargarita sinensis]|uniref:alpha-L-rhamnosidase n=1 Tax=Coraliomargarita sinensis TaxID=2174842 RepID=A0A317ZGA2_9BACT|nr:family 78 glycoside hydrolase catalytic domain [Coraliomargarita sinensis]PXA04645.1 alfa-L-rhamnosidase [Coraliomargarita sinensis]